MELEPLRAFLSEKAGACEEFPFGPETLVFKVGGKMFALLGWEEEPLRVTLKCDPSLALELREQYFAIQPGYYMNKNHWNTITIDGSVPAEIVMQAISDSYTLVVNSLTKAEKATLTQS